nr:ribonuclease H-like domain-containing protein [Tanacetum cinerariifolium]
MVTRSHVGTTRPNPRYASRVSTISPLPRSYKEAFNDPNWRNAMFDVYNALIKNKTWTSVHQPEGANIVRSDYSFFTSRVFYDRFGALNYFLGISVTRDSSGMFLSHRKYAMEILKRAHMVGCNPSQTPVDTESKLGDGGTPVIDPTLYRSLAGSLRYLTFTRPDITYDMQQVCLYMHDIREPYFSALKRILQYVQGTLDYSLQLFPSTTDFLIAYSNADWAGCSTTAEAEYRGVANAVAETCWIQNLLRELHTPLSSATIVYCDN